MSFPAGLDAFLGELRADPRTAELAQILARALHALDIEGDGNRDAAGLLQAIDEVVCRPRSLMDRLAALDRLMEADRIILTRRHAT